MQLWRKSAVYLLLFNNCDIPSDDAGKSPTMLSRGPLRARVFKLPLWVHSAGSPVYSQNVVYGSFPHVEITFFTMT